MRCDKATVVQAARDERRVVGRKKNRAKNRNGRRNTKSEGREGKKSRACESSESGKPIVSKKKEG